MKRKQILFAIGVLLGSILPIFLIGSLVLDGRDLTNLAIVLLVVPVVVLVACRIIAKFWNIAITGGYKLWAGVFFITSWAVAFSILEVWEAVFLPINRIGRFVLVLAGLVFLLETIFPSAFSFLSSGRMQEDWDDSFFEEDDNEISDLDEVVAKIRGFKPLEETDTQS